ncbi:MAG TPA: hypothetical protein VMV68_04970 [Spirochaetia bacterium]|nr:hypothetical protein [Spirochaetia bacterium]
MNERLVEVEKQLSVPGLSKEERATLVHQRSEVIQRQEQLQGELDVLSAPRTDGERLEREMRSSLRELKQAKGDRAKFAAAMALISIIIEYLQEAAHGSLSEPVNHGDAGQDKGRNRKSFELEKDTEKRILKKAVDRRVPAAELPVEMDKMVERNKEEIAKNNEQIASIDGKITETKEVQKTLIDRKATLELRLNELQGDETRTDEIKVLETQLEAVQMQIDAGKQAIEALDQQRDGLLEKNKRLEEENKGAEAMRDRIADALKVVTDVLQQMSVVLKEAGADAAMPRITFTIDNDGSITVVFDGGSQAIRDRLRLGAGSSNRAISLSLDDLWAWRKWRPSDGPVPMPSFGPNLHVERDAFFRDYPEARSLLSEVLSVEQMESLRISVEWSGKTLDINPPRYSGSLGVLFKRSGRWVSLESGFGWQETTLRVPRDRGFTREGLRGAEWLDDPRDQQWDNALHGEVEDARDASVMKAVRNIVNRIREGNFEERGPVDYIDKVLEGSGQEIALE